MSLSLGLSYSLFPIKTIFTLKKNPCHTKFNSLITVHGLSTCTDIRFGAHMSKSALRLQRCH